MSTRNKQLRLDTFRTYAKVHALSGIAIALCTDNPVQICTTIGREYTVAHALGFSPAELLAITRNAIAVAFTSPERRNELLTELSQWDDADSAWMDTKSSTLSS
ncbi:hypothetical protein [Nostoc sp.]|uniref:hypothetical protein n=1 Tax=Nostoc sp. TaxID=1180 RepID=UPI002FF9D8F8